MFAPYHALLCFVLFSDAYRLWFLQVVLIDKNVPPPPESPGKASQPLTTDKKKLHASAESNKGEQPPIVIVML